MSVKETDGKMGPISMAPATEFRHVHLSILENVYFIIAFSFKCKRFLINIYLNKLTSILDNMDIGIMLLIKYTRYSIQYPRRIKLSQ